MMLTLAAVGSMTTCVCCLSYCVHGIGPATASYVMTHCCVWSQHELHGTGVRYAIRGTGIRVSTGPSSQAGPREGAAAITQHGDAGIDGKIMRWVTLCGYSCWARRLAVRDWAEVGADPGGGGVCCLSFAPGKKCAMEACAFEACAWGA